VIAEAFAGLFGHEAVGVWSAPGRVNLIGEHLDYNDGLVLPFAIDRSAIVAAAPRSDRLVRIASVQQDDLVEADLDDLVGVGWASYVVGVAWALDEHGVDLPGFDLLVDSDIPLGAGLSSSAGLEIATALALTHLAGVELAPLDLALVCHRAETGFVGAPVGVMDQVVSACATEDHALLLDCRSLETTQVPLAVPGCELLVIDTRVRHDNTDGGYAERRASCERAAKLLGVKALRDVTSLEGSELPATELRRARHVVSEIARVRGAVDALRAGDTVALGAHMQASHRSLRDDFEVSCLELDLCVDAALAAGALGARLTGAGFGGCVIALVPEHLVADVTAAVHRAFGPTQLEPLVLSVRPSAGAGRIA
jgi:galactokinase